MKKNNVLLYGKIIGISVMLSCVLIAGFLYFLGPKVLFSRFVEYAALNQAEINQTIEGVEKKMLKQMDEDFLKNLDPETKDSLFLLEEGKYMGNADGKQVVVAFVDYKCSYCKEQSTLLKDLVSKNADLVILFRELVFLSEKESYLGAVAALAAHEQGAYIPMHHALFEQEGEINEPLIEMLVEKLSLDKEKLFADMSRPEIQQKIEDNFSLAQKFSLRGVPFYISKNYIHRGVLEESDIRKF